MFFINLCLEDYELIFYYIPEQLKKKLDFLFLDFRSFLSQFQNYLMKY